MQEAIAEAALNEVPFVVFNMARGQQDYFQATRGGGWGDYRTLCLAPKDVAEAVEHTQLLFHLADQYRSPVMMYGDYLVAHTYMSVDVTAVDYGPLPAEGLGPGRQPRRDRPVPPDLDLGHGQGRAPGPGPDAHWQHIADKFEEMAGREQRWEASHCEDADTVMVSFGTAGPFVEQVVEELRADGVRIGAFRPITLWPFPEAALAEACRSARRVLVFEVNAGQMIDDVRLAIAGRAPVSSLGGSASTSAACARGDPDGAVDP